MGSMVPLSVFELCPFARSLVFVRVDADVCLMCLTDAKLDRSVPIRMYDD
jgi:hypothetical protein